MSAPAYPMPPDVWMRLTEQGRAVQPCGAIDDHGARCQGGGAHKPGAHDFVFPDPASTNYLWMVELTEEQRRALPAIYHRPHFEGVARPPTWICIACWGDGWTTQWPCKVAVESGAELAQSLGLGWSS